ncbi:MAG: CBS domain-containing protein [Ectothiorhodospiraceae bacterium]|nr:CBS domain-containing protein [Ectothiorhodospiraceae bacterium]
MHTVNPATTVTDAVHMMNQRNIGAVAVMDGGRLAGIFTERDVLRRVIDGGMNPDSTPVAEVMTREVVVIAPDATVRDALVLVDTRNCRHLPVMDGDRLVGMLSVRDLIGAVVAGQEHRIAELTDYIYGGYGPHVGAREQGAE